MSKSILSSIVTISALISGLWGQDFVFPDDDFVGWTPPPPKVNVVPSRIDTANKVQATTQKVMPDNRVGGSKISIGQKSEFIEHLTVVSV